MIVSLAVRLVNHLLYGFHFSVRWSELNRNAAHSAPSVRRAACAIVPRSPDTASSAQIAWNKSTTGLAFGSLDAAAAASSRSMNSSGSAQWPGFSSVVLLD